jgi:hypothetical protein
MQGLQEWGGQNYENFLIWIDRTGPGIVSFAGGSLGQMHGRLYALQSDVDLTGNSGVNLTLNMSMVAATFKFAGNGLFTIPYDPILAPKIRVYALVE